MKLVKTTLYNLGLEDYQFRYKSIDYLKITGKDLYDIDFEAIMRRMVEAEKSYGNFIKNNN